MAMQLSTAPGAKPYDEWIAQLNASYGLDKGIIARNSTAQNYGQPGRIRQTTVALPRKPILIK